MDPGTTALLNSKWKRKTGDRWLPVAFSQQMRKRTSWQGANKVLSTFQDVAALNRNWSGLSVLGKAATERTRLPRLLWMPVDSPCGIPPEYSTENRLQPDRENAFAGASGGPRATKMRTMSALYPSRARFWGARQKVIFAGGLGRASVSMATRPSPSWVDLARQ